MTDVDKLLSEYIAEHRAGGRADPLEYLNRVEGTDRAELTELIDAYLSRSPGQPWDPEAYRGSGAERAAESLGRSLEGLSGWWPMVLPRLRARSRLTREEVVRRLSATLGVAGREQKVGDYYHRMEHGSLPASGVSKRVLVALGEIYGSSAERLEKLGERIAEGTGGPASPGAAPALLRKATPDERYEADDILAAELKAEPVTPARDEIDEMFTGGS